MHDITILGPTPATSGIVPDSATIPRLSVRTRALAAAPDLLSLLPTTGPGDAAAWVRRGDGRIGWGCAAQIRTEGPDRFAEAEAWWRAVVAAAGAAVEGLVAFGSFAFSPHSPAGGVLRVPEIVVSRCAGRACVTTIVDADAVAGPGGSGETVTLDAVTRAHDALWAQAGGGESELRSPGEVAFSDGARSGPAWQSAVADAVARIGAGELDKVVLARDLYAEAADVVDPRWLLRRLAAEYENTWVFAVDGLVGATPEMLCRLERGLVTSRVLAGTIRRTGDDERDLALAGSLARSSKDLEEHEYAVRSVADALAPHCTSMNLPEAPFVLHLPNVMHLATDVTGRLTNGATSITLAAALHPSAAVCGTPRDVAARVIDELEGMDRRRYAGPVGWVDASGDGEWGIALRCGELDADDPRRVRLFAGCGIVAGSDPAAELAESAAKLVPMRSALAAGPLAGPSDD
ncbi:MAG: chorismate-binding protein [Austwickia sp.]|nr:MAG: chorismate-binding protein [Austwickia sp.]